MQPNHPKIKPTLRYFLPAAGAMLLTLSFQGQAAPKECKELSKTQCEKSESCSWVKGYTTKKGTDVSAHCRSKPKQSGLKKSKSEKSG